MTIENTDPESPRRVVFVDTESTGLNPADGHFAVSAGWWDLTTGRHGDFITRHTWRQVAEVAHPAALRVNRYLDTIDGHAQDNTANWGAAAMWDALDGAVWAFSKPAHDLPFIPSVFARLLSDEDRADLPTPATHRAIDLENYAAGRLGLDITDLPGQSDVCRMLGVTPGNHTAADDVRAGGECLLRLRDDVWVSTYRTTLDGRDPFESFGPYTIGARAADTANRIAPRRYTVTTSASGDSDDDAATGGVS